MGDATAADPVVLLPLRAPGDGLTRLAGTLETSQRARLATAMLTDVVRALRGAGLTRLTALTVGAGAAEAADRLGLEVWPDADPDGAGLDAAVAAAFDDLPAGRPAAVVMPDLPLLGAADAAALVEPDAAVVVAPTADGGTGALLSRPAGAIPPAFGPGSAERHLRLATERGLSTATVERAGLTTDLDTPADLRRLAGRAGLGAQTRAVLDRLRPVPG